MSDIFIRLERPIAFYPQLARLFKSVNAAIYLQQLLYWSDKSSREDGYIFKSKMEIEEETALTRDQQDATRKRLEKAGVLETKIVKARGAPTIHFKINKERLNEVVSNNSVDKKREKADCGNSTNGKEEKPQCISGNSTNE